jgi:hypothetical protein
MILIKDPEAHALTMHDGKGSSKQNVKEKQNKKEGYSKPFNDSSSSKDSSNSKKKKKGKNFTYYNKLNHEKSTCMKKQIDFMEKALQQNNLGNFIREGFKKTMHLRKVIIMLLLKLIHYLIHGLYILVHPII